MKSQSPLFFRCGSCRHAKRLKKELHEYTRVPKCICGSTDWRVDSHRRNQWSNREGVYNTCSCNGLHYPHRKGSSVWCAHSKKDPTDEDHKSLRNIF